MKQRLLLISILATVALSAFLATITSYANHHLEELPQQESESSLRDSQGQLYISPPKVLYYEEQPPPSPETEPPNTANSTTSAPAEVIPSPEDTVSTETQTKDKKDKKRDKKRKKDKEKQVDKQQTDSSPKTYTDDSSSAKDEDTSFSDEEIQEKIDRQKASQEQAKKLRLDSQTKVKQSLKRESFSTNDTDTTRQKIDFKDLGRQVNKIGTFIDQQEASEDTSGRQKDNQFKRIIDKQAIEDAADKADAENEKKEKEIRDKVKKAKKEAKEKKKFADEEKERRKSKKRQEMEERKKKLRDKQKELRDRKKKLKDKAKELQKKAKDYKKMDQNFREMEDDAKKGPPADPNCKSSTCRSIRDLRTDLAKERNQLAKDQGAMQKDIAQFNADARNYQKDQREYEKLQDKGYGMTKEEYRQHLEEQKLKTLKDARHDIRKQISDLKRRAKWQEQSKGISDKEAKDFQEEMKKLESQLKKANSSIETQQAKIFKAEAEALGLGDMYTAANNTAQKTGSSEYGKPDSGAFDKLRAEMQDRETVRNLSDSELNAYSESYSKIVKQIEGVEQEIGSDKVGDEFSAKNIGTFNADYNKLKQVDKDLKKVVDSDEFKKQRQAWRKAKQNVGDALAKMDSWHRKLESLGDADPIRKDGNFEEPQDYPGLDEQRRKNSMSFTGPKALRDEVAQARAKFENATQDYLDAAEKLSNTPMDPDSYSKLSKQRQMLQQQLQKNDAARKTDQLGIAVGDYNLEKKRGLPLGEDGKVDRKALADKVVDLTRHQIELAETSGELNAVNQKLDALNARKTNLTPSEKAQQKSLEKRQKTLVKEKDTTSILLSEKGISITEKDGVLTPSASNSGAATTWNIARKGLVDFYQKQAAARKKVEDATGKKFAGASPETPPPADRVVAGSSNAGRDMGKDLDILPRPGEKDDRVSQNSLPGADQNPQPFTHNEMVGDIKDKIVELDKDIKHAEGIITDIEKDIKQETGQEARKSHQQSRLGWINEKQKLIAQKKQLEQSSSGNTGTHSAKQNGSKRKNATQQIAQSAMNTAEEKAQSQPGADVKQLARSIKFADEMIADLEKEIKNEKRASVKRAHEEKQSGWVEERKKLLAQQNALLQQDNTQSRKSELSVKQKKQKIEVPAYFVEEYRDTQKRQNQIKDKITRIEKELDKEPAGSSVRKLLDSMKKRDIEELRKNQIKLSEYEETLKSIPAKQRAELLGEEYVDQEEINNIEAYKAYVLNSVIPVLDQNSFTTRTLTTLLLSLATRFGSSEAESILDSALDRLEETAHPTNGVLLADIVFEYITSTYQEQGEKEGARLSLLAHSHFLAGLVDNPKLQKAWHQTGSDKAVLQGSLSRIVKQLINGYEQKLSETHNDANKTLATLGDLLSVYSLPLEDDSWLAAALDKVTKTARTLTAKTKFSDPEASYRAGQQLLLGLEQVNKYLESSNDKHSFIATSSFTKLISSFAETYKLIAQSSLQLADKSEGKMAESLRENGNRMLLAEARIRFQNGDHVAALTLARKAELKTVAGRQLQTKVLIALIDETEKRYPLFTKAEQDRTPLLILQKERESLLTSLLGSENSTQERLAAAIRLARLKETTNRPEEAESVIINMLAEIPDNPVLASEQLRLKLNRAGENINPAAIAKAISEIDNPLILSAITTTLQTLINEGSIKAANLLAQKLEEANKDRQNHGWIDPQLTKVVNVQLAFTRISLHQAGEQDKDYDSRLNSLINEAFITLRADDKLESETFKALWKMLRDLQEEQRKVSGWRDRLLADVPPKGGFDTIAVQALSLGRMDLAQKAFLKQLRWFTHSENRLSSAQKISGIRRIVTKIKAISRVLESQETNSNQRLLIQNWLRDVGNQMTIQLDRYLKRWSGYANGQERTPEQVGRALSVVRALSRITLETKLAQTEPANHQQILRNALTTANKEVLKQEKLIIKIFEPYGKNIKTDSAAKRLLKIALSDLNSARAVRDGIEDLQLDSSPPKTAEPRDENYGFLEPKTERDSKLRDLQFKITGASPGTSGKALAAYRKKVGSSRWSLSAREEVLSADGSLKLAESVFGKADGDEWLNLIRAEDRLAYYERRRMQLIKEDPRRTQEERDTIFDALLKHDAEVLLAQGIASNAFSELSQKVINLGETNPNRREAERVKSLIDIDKHQRQLSYLEDARKNGRNIQRGIRSLVELRELSLAGEFDAFVEYTHRPWYQAGPARAYNLMVGMDATRQALEQTAAGTIAAELHQTLIRASYRKPDKLSKEDQLLLTKHGFLVDGKYKIPEHVKIIPTRVASEFAKTTEEGVLGATDKILNAAKATELAATIVLPGAYAARFGKGFISAMEATGSSWLAARAAGTAAEALLFAGFSRTAQTVIHPEQMLRSEMWTIQALGKEYFHSLAVLGALKLYGGASAKATGTLNQSSTVSARLAESVIRNGAVLGEAGLLTGLNGLLSGQHITQESYVENLVMIALMRGAHKDSYTGINRLKNNILKRAGYTPAEQATPARIGQTAETLARYNEWLATDHIPGRNLMIRFGGSWNKARKAFQEKEITNAEMKAMFELRRRIVDSLANEIVRELGGEVQAFGSENLTSDYDLSFVGPKAEVAVMLFNARIRARWSEAAGLGGIESGLTLDTNVYTGPRYSDFKGGRQDTWYQDIASQTASRKYLSDEAWQQYRELVISQASASKRSELSKMLDTVEQRQREFQKELQDTVERLSAQQLKTSQPSLELKTSSLSVAEQIRTKAENILYEKTLQEIVELMETYKKAGKTERRDLAQQIRNMQSKALYFAQEAYFSEAAIKHVVMNTQAAGRKVTVESLLAEKAPQLKLSMTTAEGRQSFVEQLANMYKELSHEGSSAKLSSKAAKYFIRALDAAKIAGVDLSSFKGIIESTVALNDNRSNIDTVKEILQKKYGREGGETYLKEVLEAANKLTAEIVSGNKSSTIEGSLGKLSEPAGLADVVLQRPVRGGKNTEQNQPGQPVQDKTATTQKEGEIKTENPEPGIAKRRTPRNPELMKGQVTYLPKLNKFAFEIATKLFFERFNGDWSLVNRAKETNNLLEHEGKLLEGLKQDLENILEAESRYVSEKLHGKSGPQASAYQIAFFFNHPKFADLIRRGAEDLIRKTAVEHNNTAARSYLGHKSAGELKVVLDPTLPSLGVFYPKGFVKPDGTISDGKTIYANPFFRDPSAPGGRSRLRTLDDIASTLLHEFIHRVGFNEVRAWWEQHRFLNQVGRKDAAKMESIVDEYGNVLQTGTKDLVDFIKKNGPISAARLLERELGNIYDPIYDDAMSWAMMTQISPETFAPLPLPQKSLPPGSKPSAKDSGVSNPASSAAQLDPASPTPSQSKAPRWKTREKELKHAQEILQRLGMSRDDALFTSVIQLVQNNLSFMEAVSIGAYNRAISPIDLVKELGSSYSMSDVRNALDKHLENSINIKDSVKRQRLIEQYLNGEKTAAREALEAESSPGASASINPDGSIVIKMAEKSRVSSDEATKDYDPEATREVDPEVTGDFPGQALSPPGNSNTMESQNTSRKPQHRPARLRIVTEELMRQGFSEIQARNIAEDFLIKQNMGLLEALGRAKNLTPSPGQPADKLKGYDVIKAKLRKQEAENKQKGTGTPQQ